MSKPVYLALTPHQLAYWKKRLNAAPEAEFIDVTPTLSSPPLFEIRVYDGLCFEFKFNIRLSWSNKEVGE